MFHRKWLKGLLAAGFGFALSAGNVLLADDVRYVDEGGVTYRETRRVVKRPVSETRIEERQHTVYSERLSTDYHPTQRTVMTPITEYHWEPYMANRWNPLVQPTVQYRYVPKTRWEARVEESHIPVTRRELVPEQRVTRTPVVSQRFVDEEQISRVAVSGRAGDPFTAGTGTATAARPIGGVSALTNDPPRAANTWQSADSVLMRR